MEIAETDHVLIWSDPNRIRTSKTADLNGIKSLFIKDLIDLLKRDTIAN